MFFKLAGIIHQQVGGELFEIIPTTSYPADYYEVVDINRRQRDQGVFLKMTQVIPDLSSYQTIFLGYPIWAMDLPRFMYPFLQQQNFSNKIIAPFCTSTMSGISSTENALQQLCSNTKILNGLTIQGGERGQNLFIL